VDSSAPASNRLHDLRLDAALRLLAGGSLPGSPGSAEYLQAVIDGLCELSSRDALTGLPNRRPFEAALASELDRVARTGEPALLLLLDVDHFKRINDTYGHANGDTVLKAVAQALTECLRPMDTVARIGGEEFAIVVPNCPAAFGPTVAERVRRRIESRPVLPGPGQAARVTVSVGGAYAPQWVRASAALWMERADAQLYRAKAEGRNRVSFEPATVSTVTAEEKELLFSTPFQDPA
jgi:diguanylate cyclase (GGDEF)-like protein